MNIIQVLVIVLLRGPLSYSVFAFGPSFEKTSISTTTIKNELKTFSETKTI